MRHFTRYDWMDTELRNAVSGKLSMNTVLRTKEGSSKAGLMSDRGHVLVLGPPCKGTSIFVSPFRSFDSITRLTSSGIPKISGSYGCFAQIFLADFATLSCQLRLKDEPCLHSTAIDSAPRQDYYQGRL